MNGLKSIYSIHQKSRVGSTFLFYLQRDTMPPLLIALIAAFSCTGTGVIIDCIVSRPPLHNPPALRVVVNAPANPNTPLLRTIATPGSYSIPRFPPSER